MTGSGPSHKDVRAAAPASTREGRRGVYAAACRNGNGKLATAGELHQQQTPPHKQKRQGRIMHAAAAAASVCPGRGGKWLAVLAVCGPCMIDAARTRASFVCAVRTPSL